MTPEAKAGCECGPGWLSLIEPIYDKIAASGGTVTRVKEKYGALRIDYYPAGGFSDIEEIEDDIARAEDESRHVCEMCGAMGQMMAKAGWYKVLCKDDALNLGYREKV